MRLVVTPRAAEHIGANGGEVWIWLDPRRGAVGSYVWLETHCEPPRSSRKSSFTRSSRRPHRFHRFEDAGIVVHTDFGRLDAPEELHLDVRGWRAGTRRIEAFWNGSVFVGADVPPPESA